VSLPTAVILAVILTVLLAFNSIGSMVIAVSILFLIATSLFKLMMYKKDGFNLYSDSRKGGVDFIIKSFDKKAVPIEVGIGKKNKRQITNAMRKYKSDYGIVVSNKTDHIVKDENVIFIPVQTFSLI
jgi:predicted AAA+ superfamily ATPase